MHQISDFAVSLFCIKDFFQWGLELSRTQEEKEVKTNLEDEGDVI